MAVCFATCFNKCSRARTLVFVDVCNWLFCVVFRVASRFHVCACFAIGCFVLILPWLKNSNVVVCWLRAVARVCRDCAFIVLFLFVFVRLIPASLYVTCVFCCFVFCGFAIVFALSFHAV